MKVTTSITRIELNEDEKDILREAIDILNEVNGVIDKNVNVDYVVNGDDMDLYNNLCDVISTIEDWVMTE